MVVDSLARPYRVTIPMVVLVSLVPLYVFIGDAMSSRPVHRPELALDRALPVVPAWSLVYGALYLFLIVLPVFVVREPELVRRTVAAYLTIWITSYVVFWFYPTAAPRPQTVSGSGFAVWGLRFLYGADPPFNCFPSLHVAHSFVSAFACRRVHRGVGNAAVVCAALVGLSTLYTKQHYVLDVAAGLALASIAAAIFLRRGEAPELDRRAAPYFVAVVAVIVGLLAAALFCIMVVMPKIVDAGVQRRKIASAAIAVIDDAGLDGARLRDVARAANVTTGAVTHWFDSKEAVLEAALEEVVRRTLARQEQARPACDAASFIRQAASHLPLDEDARREWRVWLAFWGRAIADERLRATHREYYEAILTRTIAALSAIGKASRRTADAVIAAIDGVGVRATLEPEHWPPRRQRETLAALLRPLLGANGE